VSRKSLESFRKLVTDSVWVSKYFELTAYDPNFVIAWVKKVG